ncbi:plastocyanin/azurin family copper-binding protein [Bordetella sp. BOR01]|uniref:cupredoxin domain-containing protein n=1 Tax=Bordetella sp. BOR01 TaxID=2854779 RepID=UPI001C457591|nr:cupredoxin family protein [Bordetella sp. BOR01]MBV7486477.1 cupredoxin family protein [Bordetella sp. BOR01]
MNKRLILVQAAAAASALMVALGASASGTHAGGHGDSHGAATIGKPGVAANVSRTIDVDMTDAMRFTPDRIEVKAGETIRFNVINSGRIRHEMVLGTEQDLGDHYQMMLDDPGMRHDEPNSISLAAGQAGDMVWHFDKAGQVRFACLEPGHYPAGMKGVVLIK